MFFIWARDGLWARDEELDVMIAPICPSSVRPSLDMQGTGERLLALVQKSPKKI